MLTGKVPEQDSLPETFKVSIPPVPKAELDQITKQLLKQVRNLPKWPVSACFQRVLGDFHAFPCDFSRFQHVSDLFGGPVR